MKCMWPKRQLLAISGLWWTLRISTEMHMTQDKNWFLQAGEGVRPPDGPCLSCPGCFFSSLLLPFLSGSYLSLSLLGCAVWHVSCALRADRRVNSPLTTKTQKNAGAAGVCFSFLLLGGGDCQVTTVISSALTTVTATLTTMRIFRWRCLFVFFPTCIRPLCS